MVSLGTAEMGVPKCQAAIRVGRWGYHTVEGPGTGETQLTDTLSPVCLKSFLKNLVWLFRVLMQITPRSVNVKFMKWSKLPSDVFILPPHNHLAGLR